MSAAPRVVPCEAASELDTVERERGDILVVELGTGLETNDEADELVAAFLQWNAGGGAILATRRGTVAHSMPQLLRLVRKHPKLGLCLDFGELYLGSEALLGSWSTWRAALRELAPNVLVVIPPTGGAERAAKTGGIVDFVLRSLAARRFRWLRRTLGQRVPLLPHSSNAASIRQIAE